MFHMSIHRWNTISTSMQQFSRLLFTNGQMNQKMFRPTKLLTLATNQKVPWWRPCSSGWSADHRSSLARDTFQTKSSLIRHLHAHLPGDELIREATVEDHQAVLDIDPEALKGFDYLPATFTTFVEGQGVKGYVCLIRDKVVGFVSTKLVDGGQTVMLSAGRIHRDHRGQRLMDHFRWHVLQRTMTSPNVKYAAMTVAYMRHRLLDKFNVTMEKKLTHLGMEVAQIRTDVSKAPVPPTSRLQPLTFQQIHGMLSQPPPHLSHLFPQQRILLNWEPHRIMADNADVIVNSCRQRVFVAATEELASIDKGNHFPVTLLTCGSSFPCQQGRVYDVDIFGSGSDKELQDHLSWHLHRLTKVAKEKTAVMRIFAEKELDGVVANLQAQLSVQVQVDAPYHAAFVLEASLVE